jgi:hypothetical protein
MTTRRLAIAAECASDYASRLQHAIIQSSGSKMETSPSATAASSTTSASAGLTVELRTTPHPGLPHPRHPGRPANSSADSPFDPSRSYQPNNWPPGLPPPNTPHREDLSSQAWGHPDLLPDHMEPVTGVEPATCRLQDGCSAN